MRLYRALPKDEEILNSHNRAFTDDKKKLGSISILDEIYSHILVTHKLNEARERRVIYSFTDDIGVASMFLKKYPQIYDRIGYIDIDLSDGSSALIDNNENIFLIKPVYRYSDWVDLAIYNLIKNESCEITSITVNNTNYTRNSVDLINTLVPSQRGAWSLAHPAREFAIICQNLTLTIFDQEEIEKDKLNEPKDYDLFLNNISLPETGIYLQKVIDYLKKDAQNLNIVAKRKENILKQLSACEKMYERKI